MHRVTHYSVLNIYCQITSCKLVWIKIDKYSINSSFNRQIWCYVLTLCFVNNLHVVRSWRHLGVDWLLSPCLHASLWVFGGVESWEHGVAGHMWAVGMFCREVLIDEDLTATKQKMCGFSLTYNYLWWIFVSFRQVLVLRLFFNC